MMQEDFLKEIGFQINSTIRIYIESISKEDLQEIYNDAQGLMTRKFYCYAEDVPYTLTIVDALMVAGYKFLRFNKMTQFESVCMGKYADMNSLVMSFIYRLEDLGIIDINQSMEAEHTALQFDEWNGRVKY